MKTFKQFMQEGGFVYSLNQLAGLPQSEKERANRIIFKTSRGKGLETRLKNFGTDVKADIGGY